MSDKFFLFNSFNTNYFLRYKIQQLARLNDHVFVEAKGDKFVPIWNIYGDCIKTLNEHTSWVPSVTVLSNGIILSASADGAVKFWLPNGTSLNTLVISGLQSNVVELKDRKFACGTGDGRICIFNQETVLKSFILHNTVIYDLILLENGCLISVSIDGVLKICNVDEEKCLKVIYYPESLFSTCKLRNGGFACSYEDGSVILHNEKGDFIKKFVGHLGRVSVVIELQDGTIVSGSDDKTIKIWNHNGKCLQTILCRSCVVSLLEMQRGVFVAGLQNGVFKILKRPSLELIRDAFVDIIFLD